MSHETFKVGEIAMWAGWRKGDPAGSGPSTPRGSEVVIVAPLQSRYVKTAEGTKILDVYEVRNCDGKHVAALPHWLRKRPPKQDWVKLCQLDVIASGTGMPIADHERSQEVARV